MALKALMLKKKIDTATKTLKDLRAKAADIETREGELEKAIDAAESPEDEKKAEEDADALIAEKAENEEAVKEAERALEALKDELKTIEREEEQPAAPEETGKDPEERSEKTMYAPEVKNLRALGEAERAAIMERSEVREWIGEIRAHIAEKRALTNVGLTIPQVFLGVLRTAVKESSKLYSRVNVRPLGGTGREVIMGTAPEAVWTECCAILNELDLTFNDAEVDCFKVGGYVKICNAILEDSDLNLADEILSAIGQAIGVALDKAILYGRNGDSTMKMPQGIVSRLAQTSAPAGYPATARAWVDMHTTHMLTISSATTGKDLFATILSDAVLISNKYSRTEKTWVMNETTYAYLQTQAMTFNAEGALVAIVNKKMPVIGGDIVIIDFIPNYVIVGGYFDLYLLAERAGQKFAQSEHAFFIQDQTVFKGTARYDGLPVIAEAFIAIGVNSTTPDATMSFEADDANTGKYMQIAPTTIAMTTTSSGVQIDANVLNNKGIRIDKPTITYTSGNTSVVTVTNKGKVEPKGTGSTTVTVASGDASAVSNVTVS